MFQVTRRRLALWYTTVTAILLLLFATGVYLYVRMTLIDRIDDTLNHVIEVVNRSLIIQKVPVTEGRYRINVEDSFRNNANGVEDDHIDLEWFDPQGELIWSTFSEPLTIPLHPNRNGETVHLSRDHLLRQVTERIEINHHVLGYLRVSHPWFEVTKPIRQLFLDLTLGTSLMVLCVAAIGWFLSGIAIKPVIESYQSLKQFTADASHELRNPIAMIQTNVEMALAYPEAETQLQQRQLKVIERLTQRLGNLVNDLLFLARSDSGIIQPVYKDVPLDALLIEVIEEQRSYAGQKGIFLSLHLIESSDNSFPTEEQFTLQGDWDQLARLFTNLISNALEYTPSDLNNASVEVELKRIKRDRHPYLKVKVKDSGTGITESALPHIFDRFYRVDPSRRHSQDGVKSGGTGLGLAIARAIVEKHHGQITVESMLNQGTTFTVILPVNSII
ncbi:integral membrane sensor signal transduction histidine kinase [Gloeothece citriformis PCC 7424]|uniref:histidine kinase n=1 Tax=Gloeothece citriformis (strain PCC 7424) TaxID=65393 RepID=B7K7H6_GLOC7|nr:HAMP domain-containing sensor histidine kinase [Gloeothece citriformis]ACK69744.1 integral membrane sensor signal transduction histidine kinase [Gloeothece citriformis PCC 7424]